MSRLFTSIARPVTSAGIELRAPPSVEHVVGDEMVRDAAPAVGAGELVEPPQTERGQQHALAGDPRLEHVIERAHAVARDHQHPLDAAICPQGGRNVGRHVEVAHLAGIDVAPAGQGEGGGHPPIIPRDGRMPRPPPAAYGVISSRKRERLGDELPPIALPGVDADGQPTRAWAAAHDHAFGDALLGEFGRPAPRAASPRDRRGDRRTRTPCRGRGVLRCRTWRRCRRPGAAGTGRRSGRRSRARAPDCCRIGASWPARYGRPDVRCIVHMD